MIYLDNCASTRPLPAAVEAMTRVARDSFGNPSSIHAAGRKAAAELARAREVVAAGIHARASEIVFASSGTEANNLVVGGVVARALRDGPVRVVTTAVEHASVRTRLAWEARRSGGAVEVAEVPVDAEGRLVEDALLEALATPAHLLTVLHCNNETGVLQDLDLLRRMRLAHPRLLLHLDIVQSHTKTEWDVRGLPADFLTASAHKVHGPRGAAFVFVRDGVETDPLLVGGAQEKFRRAGTEDVAALAGYAAALESAPPPADCRAHAAALEAAFLSGLEDDGVAHTVNGPRGHDRRMPGIVNLSFPGVANKEDLQIGCDLEGVCLSSTSACHSGVVADSHVLAAMGVPDRLRAGAVRIGLGRLTTMEDAMHGARVLARVARRLASIAREKTP